MVLQFILLITTEIFKDFLVDLYTSYWILVWQLDDLQRSFKEAFGDS